MLQPDFTNFPVLHTNAFVLRKLSIEDADEIFQLRSNDEINKYINRQKANSIEDVLQYIDKIENNIKENKGLVWSVCYKGSNKLIGSACVFNINTENYSAEIGYELLPEFHGKKIIQEILPAIIKYMFEELHLNRIEAIVSEKNVKSIRLLEKNNFIKTDIKYEEEPDVLVYELLQ